MEVEIREKIFREFEGEVLLKGGYPVSVFSFCKHLEIEERLFYSRFSSFEALEAILWKTWLDEAVSMVEADAEAGSFSAKERYLTLIFSFLEILRDHRSWVLVRFPGTTTALNCRRFERMRDSFFEFANRLSLVLPVEEVTSRLAPSDWKSKLLFPHLLSVVEYFQRDDSDGFGRTDAYVEKSVRTLFEVLEGNLLDSGFDLVRFLFGDSKKR
ncbi:MAG: hypothetical protein ACFCU4_00945 [Puniceicoccaceae bacterium]